MKEKTNGLYRDHLRALAQPYLSAWELKAHKTEQRTVRYV